MAGGFLNEAVQDDRRVEEAAFRLENTPKTTEAGFFPGGHPFLLAAPVAGCATGLVN